MPHLIEIPTELLHLIFTEVSEQRHKLKCNNIRLKGLRLLCRAFNHAIIPILFSHITIDVGGSLGPSTSQIDQLAHSHEHRCPYRVARTLEIRSLNAGHTPHTHSTRSAKQVNARLAVIEAIKALTGLREVRWTIGRADPVARVAAVVEGLCAFPPNGGLCVRVEHTANSLNPQLLQLGTRLMSFSVTTLTRESFLVTQRPDDLKLLTTLITGSPRLERLEFHLQAAAWPGDFNVDFTLPADFDLGAAFDLLPPHHMCPPHLVLDGLRVQPMGVVHRLRALQSLTLFIPRVHSYGYGSDMGLGPMWDALAVAHVFPPSVTTDDLNDAFIRYLVRHPGLDALALPTMHDSRWRMTLRNEHPALVAAFFSEALPRHAHTLRHLCIQFLDPSDPVLRDRAIAQCVLLETFASCLVWTDQPSFTMAFDRLLLLVGTIPRIQRVTLTITELRAFREGTGVTPEVERLIWDTAAARVFEQGAQCVPAEVVVHGRRFCIGSEDGVRRYVDVGLVGE